MDARTATTAGDAVWEAPARSYEVRELQPRIDTAIELVAARRGDYANTAARVNDPLRLGTACEVEFGVLDKGQTFMSVQPGDDSHDSYFHPVTDDSVLAAMLAQPNSFEYRPSSEGSSAFMEAWDRTPGGQQALVSHLRSAGGYVEAVAGLVDLVAPLEADVAPGVVNWKALTSSIDTIRVSARESATRLANAGAPTAVDSALWLKAMDTYAERVAWLAHYAKADTTEAVELVGRAAAAFGDLPK